ncbi:LOW QUALITY PROTEIN: hypothetical protein HID58_067226 [Brassica napus]|uniref:Uncharacterized protein n=1 Tax=Brassica napus TaxID=3708 RepID=A0ABQ7ZIC0_BRANA|nr:LOW QUALITY PROTEIN: hypothetical protein HID58_067226 [Brassica napus]
MNFYSLLRAPHQIPGQKVELPRADTCPRRFAIFFDLQQRRCSYALTTPTMEDLRVSLQSARHSFLQTVTGCFDSSSLMTVLTHSATPSTFPHSLHLSFVQGGESTAIKSFHHVNIILTILIMEHSTIPGKKILEEKLISLKSSFLEERIGSQKLMFLIQMALSGCQLTEWNKQSSAKEVMHRTQRDMFTCKALTHSHWVAPVHQQRGALS